MVLEVEGTEFDTYSGCIHHKLPKQQVSTVHTEQFDKTNGAVTILDRIVTGML